MKTYIAATLALLAPFAFASRAALRPQSEVFVRSESAAFGAPELLGPLTILFETAECVPSDVLDSGDAETNRWLAGHGFRTPAGAIEVRAAEDVPSLVARADLIQILKCAGAILSAAIPAAKLAKIKKAVDAIGGVRKAAELIMKAKNANEALKIGGEALKELFELVSGIDDIRENCF